ncbi:hypothetical protein [Streptomyces luteolus]|uniref:Uncharacterized protein n=1 Tax=Streptomyces luteolus TaxID=3043615 RepID=A0ABT6SNV7_9ACTN|nr:hypothetical protein [Streptomyces sp. B-S-A12]MDI3417289.1 hypothetical protein [Streptomyces sp. B-S-A12]
MANGIDYLMSVTEHLTAADPPAPRDLKYAVLHLQGAVEVLLKVRLLREHWTFVFPDLDHAKTTRDAFDSGDFKSCTTETAVSRLKKIAGVEIGERPARALSRLTKSRNALQHFGLTASAPQIEANAAEVLDFLLDFLHTQLLPSLPAAEAGSTWTDLNTVRERLATIKSFLAKRHQQIRAELAPLLHATVECPLCGQWAMSVGVEEPTCRFCLVTWDDIGHLVMNYLGTFDRPGLEEARCPECGEQDLILNARVAAHPDRASALCFSCTAVLEHPVECSSCEELYERSADDFGLCPDCLQQRIDRF